MALPVPADRHRGLDGREVVSDPPLHGGPLRPGVGPHRRRGLLLQAGGDRAGETDQAADLGHGGSGTLPVSLGASFFLFFFLPPYLIFASSRDITERSGGSRC